MGCRDGNTTSLSCTDCQAPSQRVLADAMTPAGRPRSGLKAQVCERWLRLGVSPARSMVPVLDARLDTFAVVGEVLNGIVSIKRNQRSAQCVGRRRREELRHAVPHQTVARTSALSVWQGGFNLAFRRRHE